MFKNFPHPYIIAEIGTNHDGKIHKAKQLIKIAKQSRCNAVKFQSWDETMWSDSFLKKNPDLIKDIKKLSVDFKFLKKMKNYCKKLKIDFASTPFSTKQVDELIKLKPAFIKIASMDIVNLNLIKYCVKFNYPILISTGLAQLSEIKEVNNLLKKEKKNNAAFLHCVSIYPPKDKEMNMLNMKYLKEKLDFPIGFSDHSEGSISAIQAVSLGSNIFEKHITLDKKIGGPDSAFAADPEDLKKYVKNIHKAKESLGNFVRKISNKEKKIKKLMRRSAFLKENVNKGKKLSWKSIIMQRPGGGLEYNQLKILLKKKIKFNLLKGTRLKKNHFM